MKPCLTAGFLDYCTVFGLEKVLPAHIQSIGEVANVHQPLVFELLANRGIELLVHLAAVDNGRAAAFFAAITQKKLMRVGQRFICELSL